MRTPESNQEPTGPALKRTAGPGAPPAGMAKDLRQGIGPKRVIRVRKSSDEHPVGSTETSAHRIPGREDRPRKRAWRPLAVPPPQAEPSLPSIRGPEWLVAVLDFIERATSRAMSLSEHLALFIAYTVMLVIAPIAGTAYIVGKIVDGASWPTMTSVGLLATSGGAALFVRRRQRATRTNPDAQPLEVVREGSYHAARAQIPPAASELGVPAGCPAPQSPTGRIAVQRATGMSSDPVKDGHNDQQIDSRDGGEQQAG